MLGVYRKGSLMSDIKESIEYLRQDISFRHKNPQTVAHHGLEVVVALSDLQAEHDALVAGVYALNLQPEAKLRELLPERRKTDRRGAL